MNCPFDKEKLTGYYDGELEAAEKAEVERHIASCSECLRELGELKSAAILVKELPRLRAPKSIAEGISREIQTAGKVHQFAKVRRTILWASAAAAVLFVGLNVMYFSGADQKSPPMAASTPPPAPVARIQQEHKGEDLKAAEKENLSSRRGAVDRDRALDESKLRGEMRKSLEEQEKGKLLQGRDDALKAVPDAAPAERAREKDKADGLAGKPAESKPAAAAEPAAPPKPTAAPPGAAPAPVAKQPVAESAEKAATKENLARMEKKTAADPAVAAVEAAPKHLTLASTQVSKSRIEMEAALKKIGVAMPPPPPPVKNMKAAATAPETTYALEMTDSQIARLQQELNKPGASRLVLAAPGDPVLAEFGDGRMFGRKEGAGVASGGAAAPAKKEVAK